MSISASITLPDIPGQSDSSDSDTPTSTRTTDEQSTRTGQGPPEETGAGDSSSTKTTGEQSTRTGQGSAEETGTGDSSSPTSGSTSTQSGDQGPALPISASVSISADLPNPLETTTTPQGSKGDAGDVTIQSGDGDQIPLTTTVPTTIARPDTTFVSNVPITQSPDDTTTSEPSEPSVVPIPITLSDSTGDVVTRVSVTLPTIDTDSLSSGATIPSVVPISVTLTGSDGTLVTNVPVTPLPIPDSTTDTGPIKITPVTSAGDSDSVTSQNNVPPAIPITISNSELSLTTDFTISPPVPTESISGTPVIPITISQGSSVLTTNIPLVTPPTTDDQPVTVISQSGSALTTAPVPVVTAGEPPVTVISESGSAITTAPVPVVTAGEPPVTVISESGSAITTAPIPVVTAGESPVTVISESGSAVSTVPVPVVPQTTGESPVTVISQSGSAVSTVPLPVLPQTTGEQPVTVISQSGSAITTAPIPVGSQTTADQPVTVISQSGSAITTAPLPVNVNPTDTGVQSFSPTTIANSDTTLVSNVPLVNSATGADATITSGATQPTASGQDTVASVSGGAVTSGTDVPATVSGSSGSQATESGASASLTDASGSPIVQTSGATSGASDAAGATETASGISASGTASGAEASASASAASGSIATELPASVSGSAATATGVEQTSQPPALQTEVPASTVEPVNPNTQSYVTAHTLAPTGTDSATAQVIPSSIVLAPTLSSGAPTQSLQYGSTGIPSSLPHVIIPGGGLPPMPPDTTLVQIGFLYPLNYPFVLANSVSQKQIFKYLPDGIAYGLNISAENVTMQTLRADDTSQELLYITTLALAYIPSSLVGKLALDLHTPASQIYHSPDASVRTLCGMINPAMPIRADDTMGGSPTGGASPSETANDGVDGGAPIGNGLGNSGPVRASSAAIGVGVVAGAAAYGAAMFFVARRYKQRRLSHQRSPSLLSSPVLSGQHGQDMATAALMSGAMREHGTRSASPLEGYGYGRTSRGSGRSGGSQRPVITNPIMSENSLGWN